MNSCSLYPPPEATVYAAQTPLKGIQYLRLLPIFCQRHKLSFQVHLPAEWRSTSHSLLDHILQRRIMFAIYLVLLGRALQRGPLLSFLFF